MIASSGYLKNKKISASQLSTWIKSPKEYIKTYIDGKPFIGNKYTDFGTYIHKLIEDNDERVSDIPKLKHHEYYFEKEFNGAILNGYIDSYDVGEIIDYKVSKAGKWSPKDVEKNVQMKFYGLWHLLENQSMPKISLIHIESEEIIGKLQLTGKATNYIKTIKEKDIEYIKSKINEFVLWCEQYKNDNK